MLLWAHTGADLAWLQISSTTVLVKIRAPLQIIEYYVQRKITHALPLLISYSRQNISPRYSHTGLVGQRTKTQRTSESAANFLSEIELISRKVKKNFRKLVLICTIMIVTQVPISNHKAESSRLFLAVKTLWSHKMPIWCQSRLRQRNNFVHTQPLTTRPAFQHINQTSCFDRILLHFSKKPVFWCYHQDFNTKTVRCHTLGRFYGKVNVQPILSLKCYVFSQANVCYQFLYAICQYLFMAFCFDYCLSDQKTS